MKQRGEIRLLWKRNRNKKILTLAAQSEYLPKWPAIFVKKDVEVIEYNRSEPVRQKVVLAKKIYINLSLIKDGMREPAISELTFYRQGIDIIFLREYERHFLKEILENVEIQLQDAVSDIKLIFENKYTDII